MSSSAHTAASSVSIRDATASDHATIAALTREAYIQGGFLKPGDSYLTQLENVAYRASNSRVLVAENGGDVVGSIVVIEAHEPLAEVSRPGELEIRMLAVHPQAQGLGVGRALVRYSLQLAYARPDISALSLCSLSAMTTAHALYASEGFVKEPDRDFYVELDDRELHIPFFINYLGA